MSYLTNLVLKSFIIKRKQRKQTSKLLSQSECTVQNCNDKVLVVFQFRHRQSALGSRWSTSRHFWLSASSTSFHHCKTQIKGKRQYECSSQFKLTDEQKVGVDAQDKHCVKRYLQTKEGFTPPSFWTRCAMLSPPPAPRLSNLVLLVSSQCCPQLFTRITSSPRNTGAPRDPEQ